MSFKYIKIAMGYPALKLGREDPEILTPSAPITLLHKEDVGKGDDTEEQADFTMLSLTRSNALTFVSDFEAQPDSQQVLLGQIRALIKMAIFMWPCEENRHTIKSLLEKLDEIKAHPFVVPAKTLLKRMENNIRLAQHIGNLLLPLDIELDL